MTTALPLAELGTATGGTSAAGDRVKVAVETTAPGAGVAELLLPQPLRNKSAARQTPQKVLKTKRGRKAESSKSVNNMEKAPRSENKPPQVRSRPSFGFTLGEQGRDCLRSCPCFSAIFFSRGFPRGRSSPTADSGGVEGRRWPSSKALPRQTFPGQVRRSVGLIEPGSPAQVQ